MKGQPIPIWAKLLFALAVGVLTALSAGPLTTQAIAAVAATALTRTFSNYPDLTKGSDAP